MTLAAAPPLSLAGLPYLDECPVEDDPEVVLAEELAPVIAQLIADINAELDHDHTGGLSNNGGVKPIGAVTRAEELHKVNPRVFARLLNGESMTVTLDLADKLILSLDSNISMVLPEDAFYRRSEVIEATKIQMELLCQIARCRGEYVPPPGQRKAWPEAMRRKLAKEKRAA